MKKFFRIVTIIVALCVGCFLGYKMLGKPKIKNYITPSRVFLTGNLHGKLDIDKIMGENFKVQAELGSDDNLIVVGDFGLIWDENIEDEMILDKLADKKYNILFVDGAHENFNLLNQYEVVDLYGGKAHKIRDNIYHLMRGEIYTIGGKKYLAFGGGESKDKQYREKGISYWDEEIPNKEEWNNLQENLSKHNNYIDYILTYTPPSSDLRIIGAELGRNLGKGTELNRQLQLMSENVKYKKWFHSYYHLDLEISRKHTNLYNNIIEVK